MNYVGGIRLFLIKEIRPALLIIRQHPTIHTLFYFQTTLNKNILLPEANAARLVMISGHLMSPNLDEKILLSYIL